MILNGRSRLSKLRRPLGANHGIDEHPFISIARLVIYGCAATKGEQRPLDP